MKETDEEQIAHIEGLFVGQCKPEEYEHLIEKKLLRFSYEGASGFLGLAKLKRVEKETTMAQEPSTQLIVSFKHYEHQGIDLKLVSTIGGYLLQVERADNGNVLLKVELPKSTSLLDRRA